MNTKYVTVSKLRGIFKPKTLLELQSESVIRIGYDPYKLYHSFDHKQYVVSIKHNSICEPEHIESRSQCLLDANMRYHDKHNKYKYDNKSKTHKYNKHKKTFKELEYVEQYEDYLCLHCYWYFCY
jgi:hypothetical protein